MARFRVLERSFIDNRLVEVGEEVDYDGIPSANLEAVDKAAKAARAKAPKADAASEIASELI
jgi:hypothetical protein